MRVLAFVDIHGSFKAIDQIKEKSDSADILVCAGDVSRFETDLDKILGELNSIGKKIVMVHGNHEEAEGMEKLCRHFSNIEFIHRKKLEISGFTFLGFGGGGFEKEVAAMEDFFNSVSVPEKSVFVTHAPPYKTKLDKLDKSHNGNNSLRNLIIKYKPLLSISGHFHENWGKKDFIGDTFVINPGPEGVILELD